MKTDYFKLFLLAHLYCRLTYRNYLITFKPGKMKTNFNSQFISDNGNRLESRVT